MTKNVSYKECTCDFCRTKEHIAQSSILPKQWTVLRLKKSEYDLCEQCTVNVEQAIEKMMKGGAE